jgi:hypothetical protein
VQAIKTIVGFGVSVVQAGRKWMNKKENGVLCCYMLGEKGM